MTVALNRHARKRIDRLVDKGLSYETAVKVETKRCPDCKAGYCPCGKQDLPHITSDHYKCMHRIGLCSQKVAEKMKEDKEKAADRMLEAAKTDESPV